MLRITCLAVLLSIVSLGTHAQGLNTKILLIPLDDRPPCLQYTVKMGLIGHAEVIAPPRDMLGKFTTAGNPEKIIEWIRQQDLPSFKAVIVSIDMLAYGGLVASRIHQTTTKAALQRIKIISEIRKKAPELPVYGQSVIMRLAPTSDGKNENYREQLARWASISPYPENKAERLQLESEIPEDALQNYKSARQRNLDVNQEAIRLTESGILDYLILSQDDAKPMGVHVADREKLTSEINNRKLTTRVLVQPGTDEISMLLLSRALNELNQSSPKVFVKYSSETTASTAMPFEDRPLRQTVSFNIIAAGGIETAREADADLLFYVFPSRFDSGSAETFAADIAKKVADGKRVMIADIDSKGNTQGGDPVFTEALLSRRVFTKLYSYASWNTAGNTIGTSLPQGLIFRLAENKLMINQDASRKIRSAQNWFILHRLMDDYAFHTIVRPKSNEYFKQSNRSGFERTDETAREVEHYSYGLLLPLFDSMKTIFSTERVDSHSTCLPTALTFSLPWNRTFEAEIDFKMNCD